METAEETALRLLAALEILVAEDEFAVRAGEFEQTLAVQKRAEPVIVRLAQLLSRPGLSDQTRQSLSPRLTGLRARRAASLEVLNSRLVDMQASLATLDAAYNQLGDLKSAYGVERQRPRRATAGLNLSA